MADINFRKSTYLGSCERPPEAMKTVELEENVEPKGWKRPVIR